ncbi:MAG: High-affinity branched-chain amino acid transport system permease protein LivH, partial [uncultured Microvirga sp.]
GSAATDPERAHGRDDPGHPGHRPDRDLRGAALHQFRAGLAHHHRGLRGLPGQCRPRAADDPGVGLRLRGGGSRRLAFRRVRPEAAPGIGLHHHRDRLDRAHHRARKLRPLRLRQPDARLRPAAAARLGDFRPQDQPATGREPGHRRRGHGAALRLPVPDAHRQGDAGGGRQSHAGRHQGHQRRHGGAPRVVHRHGSRGARRHADRPRRHDRPSHRLQDHPVGLRGGGRRGARQHPGRGGRRAGGRRRRGTEPLGAVAGLPHGRGLHRHPGGADLPPARHPRPEGLL